MYLTMPPFFSSSANAFLKGVGVLGVGSTKLLLTLFGVDWSWSLFLPIWLSFTGCNGNECGVLRGPELFSFSCSACCCKGVDCAVTVHRRRGVADNPTSKDRFGLFKNWKKKTPTLIVSYIRHKCIAILSLEKVQKCPHKQVYLSILTLSVEYKTHTTTLHLCLQVPVHAQNVQCPELTCDGLNCSGFIGDVLTGVFSESTLGTERYDEHIPVSSWANK